MVLESTGNCCFMKAIRLAVARSLRLEVKLHLVESTYVLPLPNVRQGLYAIAYRDRRIHGLRAPCTPTHVGGSYRLIELSLRPAYSYGIYCVCAKDTQ